MSNSQDSTAFHILLVEDNPADIYLFRQALRSAELTFELTVISDGGDALAFAQGDGRLASGRVPDLLVLDLNLPKVGGCDVLEAVRKNANVSTLAVAVLTSSDASRDFERCTGLGVARYLTKPLELDEFLRIGEVVKQILLESVSRQDTRTRDAQGGPGH